ncbi:MAG: hypothetical protein HOU81_23050 [Hamadaea sp.]|uniref:hypothetical protein n=1 Tax=Hamadaea sp. TaxID=2024425 RepID=UPI0017F3242D|nr:hypothetical protein [Hamadaea sp.]NUR73703.1 hypothetical protein [Hamadaea sp.]NUT22553.1 hypothetical protein [Hamadaea sp.]
MTGQIPDEVRYHRRRYAIAAIDGAGLFDPADHGLEPSPLSTGCWRGYCCRYVVKSGRLVLNRVEISVHDTQLYGRSRTPQARPWNRGAAVYDVPDVVMPFTGRLLIGAEVADIAYLNMGFWPAWGFLDVVELIIADGEVTATHDRSVDLAAVRDRIAATGTRPEAGEASADWIKRTFSLAYAYSWPDS